MCEIKQYGIWICKYTYLVCHDLYKKVLFVSLLIVGVICFNYVGVTTVINYQLLFFNCLM